MMKKDSPWKNLILITQVGLTFLVPVALLTALGLWIKNSTGASWPFAILLPLGIVSGVTAAWSLIRRFAPDPKDDEEPETYDLMKEWKTEEKEDHEEQIL